MSKIIILRLYPVFILGTGTFSGTFSFFLGTDNLVLSRVRGDCYHVPNVPTPKLEREIRGGTYRVKLEVYFCHLSQLCFLVIIFREVVNGKKAN